MPLVVSRKDGEAVVITLPDQRRINVVVARSKGRGNQTKVQVDAPDDVLVDRLEVVERREAKAAKHQGVSP